MRVYIYTIAWTFKSVTKQFSREGEKKTAQTILFMKIQIRLTVTPPIGYCKLIHSSKRDSFSFILPNVNFNGALCTTKTYVFVFFSVCLCVRV